MKKYLVIILLIFINITACKKEDNYFELYGTWKVYAVPADILGNPQLIDFDFDCLSVPRESSAKEDH